MDAVAAKVVALHIQFERHCKMTVEKAAEIGHILSDRKAALGYDNGWMEWCKTLVLPDGRTISHPTLLKYMKLYRATQRPEILTALNVNPDDQQNLPKSNSDQQKARRALPEIHQSSMRKIEKAVRRMDKEEKAAELTEQAQKTPLIESIIHGDSLEWLGKQKTGTVPCFLTDPPYGIGFKYGTKFVDPKNAIEYWKWFSPWWTEMQRVLMPGGIAIIWQAQGHLRHLWDWFGGDIQLVTNCFMIRDVRQYEAIVVWTKKGGKRLSPLKRHPTGWVGTFNHRTDDDEPHTRHIHPCAKPISTCREIVREFTFPGTLVVDPFCGQGSIPVACKIEGRKCIGIEQEEKWARVASQQVLDATPNKF